jgi:fibronectin type 3 domain-containing protein
MKTWNNFFNAQKLVSFRVLVALMVLTNLVAAPFQTPVLAAGTNCIITNTGTYTITPCITAPLDGATVSGAVTVSADNGSPTGANPGIAKYIFYLTQINQPTAYLLTKYQSPYTFILPSNKFVDGTYSLQVVALMKDGTTSDPSSITITLNNGVTTPPVPNNTFAPTTGTTPPAGQPFTLVATGDGADGATNSGNVTTLINSWDPNLFLYLGDVYEKGTATEFYNSYGQSNTFYGRFKAITDPIIGNHEYENGIAPGYHDYWDLGNNAPTYYSYDAAGWHFIALNSNCGLLHICDPGQAEYQWLLNDLNTHNNVCTIAYFHHPVFNIGYEGYATSMNNMWALMAQHGVDIVLTGHDHDYQRWVPLDGNINNQSPNGFGNPSSTGMTQFVAGGGGHGVQTFKGTDSRMVIGYDTSPYTFGALRLQLNSDGAGFQYINYQGLLLDSGAIPCNGAPTDVTAPSTPASLTATTHSATQADLSWGGSTDNVGIAGYDIYRDGSLLTSVGYVTSYSDTNLTLGSTHSYQIKARDAANNTSSFSNTATVTLPSLLFSDGFESGDFSAWTLPSGTSIAITSQEHYAGVYAAHATSNGSTASYAYKSLTTAQSDLYYTLRFKIISKSSGAGGTSAYVQRFRSGTTGGTSIGGVLISSTNKLGYRNDAASTSNTNGPIVTLGVWHEVQTHLHIDTNLPGTNGHIEIWYDGAPVSALNATENFGTAPISRVYVGDSTPADVYDVVLDDAAFNTSFIDTTDSQSPNTPTGLSANATAPNSVSLTWNAATDNISVTGYDLYRNGALTATLGAVTNYTDTPVSPNFTYQYQIRARDAAGNVSGLNAPASVTTPADTTLPVVALTAPADGLTVNGTIQLSADATDNVDVEDVDFLVNGVVVGTVAEGGPYNVLWDTTTVADGTPAVITARAVDTSSNSTTSSSRTVTVDNASGDTLPPSLPGNFMAVAAGATRVDLSWNASTDNVGVTAYDVYRDGVLLTSTNGATIGYSDSNVAQGATYQYQVRARDAANNVSGLTSAASITIPAPLFKDGFESGNLSGWVNQGNGLLAQQQTVLEGTFAAEANSSGPASWAYTLLGTPKNDLYAQVWFKIISKGANNVNLLRFRSGTTGTGGAILGVFVSSTGKLGITNDAGGGSTTSVTTVNPGWHSLQAHVNIVTGQVEVWLDGVSISALNQTLNLGSTPVARIQLGESTAGRTYDVAFDEVAYDTSLLQTTSMLNTVIDSGPLGLVNSNSASFNFSSTFTGPTLSFECSLDTSAFSACTSPAAFTGLADGSHTFAVRALDGLGGVDQTPASRIWTVDTTPPTVTNVLPTDGATGLATNATARATFSEPAAPASVSTSSFILTLQGDTTPIPATVTYDVASNTTTLQPSAPLGNSTVYTATIKGGPSGATDLAGNPLAADMVWSFTTVAPDTAVPIVDVTAPADGATVAGTVTLFANATDDVGVSHVDFLVNGSVVGTVTTAPYTMNWNSKSVANGLVTITAQAYDTSNNQGVSAPVSATVNNDVTAPSVPADLAANALSGAQVDLTWTASTDDFGVTGYDIFRNGVQLTTVGTVVNYSDTTVAPSTPYQYQIQARDAAGNVSAHSATANVTTPGALFNDRFESGDLSQWVLVNGMTVQQQQVFAGQYAARATSTGAIVDALADLGGPQYDLYYDIRLKILGQDPTSSTYVMRFKKADALSALGVFVSSTGKFGYRNDIAGVANTSTASVSLNVWHEVQVHIQIDSAGGPGLVETWLDGVKIQSQAEALGNAPITRIQLSDNTAGHTYDLAFDNVVAALNYINPGDIMAPSVPTNVNAPAISATQVDLTWDPSSDDFGVVGYDLYRNSTLLAALGPVTSYSDTTVVPDTTYHYQISAHDAAENISGLSNSKSVTTLPDTTPPSVSLIAPINGARIGGTVTLLAIATDDVAVDHVDFLVNGSVVDSDTTSPYSFDWNSALLPDGPAAITASAVDTSSNSASSAGNVTLDNTAPDTSITSSPLPISNSTTANFSFTTNDPTSSLSCSLDGAAFTACTSPKSYTALTNAQHTFQVRATDPAGNVDPTPATLSWTVDSIAPTVSSTIPTTNATNVPPITTVVANFSEAMNPATITTSTFTVKKKQGGSPVSATVTYDPTTNKATLQPTSNLAGQTAYTATITGGTSGVKDLAGNALGTTYSWNFTTSILDTSPPTVTLTAPTNGANVKGSVTLSATASDNVIVSSVSFLVNGAVVSTDTTSPYSFVWNSASIADGLATVSARAVDPSNNAATTTSISVTVDNTPPDTTITSGPTGTVSSTTASFGFTATETATFACKLDGASFSACTSPVSYTGLAGGAHTFQVQAIDAAGNVDATPASQSWTVVVPPDTTITAGPSGTVTTTSASFSFTSTITGSTFACSLDGSAFSTCTSPTSYNNLANGSHTFQVAATAQGITDPTPASRTWTITLAPDTTITAGPTGTVSSTSASFSFTATVGGSTFTCSLDGAVFSACTSPKAYSGLTNGSHTFQVAATSQGATDPTPASRTWTIDTVAPTGVAITSPTNGASVTGQVTISASASDNIGIAQVDFYIDGQLLTSDTSAPFSIVWNTKKFSTTTHTIYARAVDAAGNTTQSATITVTVR